jgi:UDP-N-acetylmuramoylalanine--D-glutamate ligase
MRVLIFGLGTLGGGFAAAKYFLDKGDEVRITDLRSESVLGGPLAILKSKGAMAILQEHRKEDFLWADIVIKNPAVAATHPLLEFATRVESDLSFLFTSSLMKGIDVIAITGTKGKTTTAAATAHVLGQCGFEAMQCGNMGISGFSVLTELQARFDSGRPMPRYVVCELSSWQIRDLYCSTGNHMPQFKIVVMTSLFPDHLNSYGDFNAYKHDKWLLLSSKSNQILVSQDLFDDVKANATLGSNKLLAIESIPGAKRIETRFQPTWAICRRLGIQSKQLASALGSFRGVPHRQEQVAMGGNIVFINDSSATIPEAVSFSTTSCPWQYVLICGGTDKNLLAEPMLNALKRALSIHILDGSFTRNKLLPLLQAHELDYQGPFGTMKEAFDSALASAQAVLGKRSDKPIVAVMLSPGAASFVFFKHEFDRGDQFKALAIEAAGKLSGLV